MSTNSDVDKEDVVDDAATEADFEEANEAVPSEAGDQSQEGGDEDEESFDTEDEDEDEGVSLYQKVCTVRLHAHFTLEKLSVFPLSKTKRQKHA